MGSPFLPLPSLHFIMFAAQFGYLGRGNQNGFCNMCPVGEGVGTSVFFLIFFIMSFIVLLFINFGPAKKPEHSYLDSYNSS